MFSFRLCLFISLFFFGGLSPVLITVGANLLAKIKLNKKLLLFLFWNVFLFSFQNHMLFHILTMGLFR